VVGTVVRQSLDGEGDLASLVADHPDLGPDAAALVGPGMAVSRRTTPGGGGPGPVAVQLEQFAAALDHQRARLPA
jgi:argininosuccinate lyase